MDHPTHQHHPAGDRRRPSFPLARRPKWTEVEWLIETFGTLGILAIVFIVIARFVPIVRTFASVMAGVAQTGYRAVATFDVIGATASGHRRDAAGLRPRPGDFIRANIEFVIVGIVVVSTVPIGPSCCALTTASAAQARRGCGAGAAQPSPVQEPVSASSRD